MTWKVILQPSGHHFNVDETENVLDAALRQGVVLPYGCRNGRCGRCKGRIVAGKFECGGEALSDAERQQGMALTCCTFARSDLTVQIDEIREAGEIPVRKCPAKVRVKEQLAPDVMRLYLKLSGAQRLQFMAGQYIDILFRDGKRRAFSIANSPTEADEIELHIRHHAEGAFSHHVFSALQEKALLRIEGPFGEFCLREKSSNPMIFIAGGTGFAPVKGIIEYALGQGVNRPIYLYWGARTPVDLYLNGLVEQWVRAYDFVRYVPVLSQVAEADQWTGRIGLVHEAVVNDFPDIRGYDVYAAGPPLMVKAVWESLTAHGLDPAHFFSDPFDYAQS